MTAKRYKLRGSAIAVLSAFMLGGVAIGIHGSEPCRRFVQRVVYKAVPHHYSKATIERWTKWNKDHPNYHPPKKRPEMSAQEVTDKVNFACEVDPEPVLVAGLLPMGPTPLLALSPQVVTVSTAPPPVGTPVSLVNAPPNGPTINVGDVPEPTSWIFLATGLTFIAFCSRKRFAGTNAVMEA